jgi:hypothetical protein
MSTMGKATKVNSPPWYKLENYSRQATLDLPGWLLQLGIRRDLRTLIHSETNGSSEKLKNGVALELIGHIHRDPFLRIETLVKCTT